MPGATGAVTVLRVGVTDGSQPCSYRQNGVWQGLAVELWQKVASRERIPFVFSTWPTIGALLEASERGDIDVAVGCMNVSTERLKRYRFSLPIQEGGQSLMVRRTPLALGQAIVAAVLAPELLQLLGGFLVAILLVTVALWWVEGHRNKPETQHQGWRRSFAKDFQILATGPGTNTVAITTRGHTLVLLSYLIRIVSASLLVSYVTVNVVRAPLSSGGGSIRSLRDLEGKTVAARPGSISEQLLLELNQQGGQAAIRIRPLPQVQAAGPMIMDGLANAVLADDLQLEYVLQGLDRSRVELVLRGLQPESQAFAYSPMLPRATAGRIDLAISELKGSGVVATLRRHAIGAAQNRDPR
ncbi:transporter substrate-binding domain-containing protein [Cyanobium sp. Morenito 9A2]|nr:transporter substrate-binding domain-containing protein [Cyanobium sp. Morenito 9A2]